MKIIVIGLGSMGRRRIRLLKQMRSELSLIGVDSNKERVQSVSQEFGMVCYSDLEQAIRSEKEAGEPVSCAMVCSSPLSHAGLIGKCLTYGLNVFTEINLVADEYQENMALAEEKGCKLFLSSTPVYRAEMKKIREVLADKTGNDSRPVNYIYHVGQYLPDWHPWEQYNGFFVGDKRTNGCREILAIELPWMIKAFGQIKELRSFKDKITDLQIDYPDNYFIYITHANGAKGIFAVDVVCREAVRHMEIYNENIYMEWDGTPDSLRKKNLATKEFEKILEKEAYERREGYSAFVNEYAYINELEAFFQYLEEGKEPEYGFAEDLELLHWIDEIEK
ncbi:MAG: Gfo/Idh/MocA family oxidoreductase [Lachnoclostridium sp.]|nr:Gfo/Idh/MocA family oxidoreductase [Lachnoclostridium sp.]